MSYDPPGDPEIEERRRQDRESMRRANERLNRMYAAAKECRARDIEAVFQQDSGLFSPDGDYHVESLIF